MTRSQCAIIRGAHGADCTDSMPSASKTASKDSVYLPYRSAYQETQRLAAHAQLDGEVTSLLYRPLRGWMRGHAGNVQAARAVLEEDQRIHAAQVHQVDMQEIAGDDAIGLCRQELAPRGAAAARRRSDAGSGQDLPDWRRRSDAPAVRARPGSCGTPTADSPEPAVPRATSSPWRSAACPACSGACCSPTCPRQAFGARRARPPASLGTRAPSAAGVSARTAPQTTAGPPARTAPGAVSCLRSTAFSCRRTSNSASLVACRHRSAAGTESSFRVT